MRTVLTQKHIALMVAEFANREGAKVSAVLFSKFDDGKIGAVVTHDFEFELPTDWQPPQE